MSDQGLYLGGHGDHYTPHWAYKQGVEQYPKPVAGYLAPTQLTSFTAPCCGL